MPAVTIPLTPIARVAEAVAPRALTIPLRLGAALSPAPPSTSQVEEQEQVVRAIAAAVALHDPTAAAEAAKTVRDNPAALPAITAPTTAVISAVRNVQLGTTKAAQATPEQIAVAESIRATPSLVSAAFAAMAAPANAQQLDRAREWVAGVDHELLANAARVALRRKAILEAEPAAQATGIAQRVTKLEEDFTALKARVEALENPAPPPATNAQGSRRGPHQRQGTRETAQTTQGQTPEGS